MKKIFTLFAAAAVAISMSAADFQLYFKDQPVTDGASYTTYVQSDGEEDYGDVIAHFWKQDSELYAHGDPGTSVTVICEAVKGSVLFCGLSTTCEQVAEGKSKTHQGTLKEDGQSLEIDVKGETYDDEKVEDVLKECVVKVTAYAGTDASKAVTVTVTMKNTVEEAGISNVAAEKTFVKMSAGNVLNYSVDTPSTLSVYAITGNLVAKYRIANTGSVNVNNLGRGLYIYTDGKHKGKFIVK